MSFTYADMQARIADEMKRGDLSTDSVLASGSTSSIQAAILSTIAQYQRTRFWFNELAYASWAAILNQESYGTTDGVPADIVAIDKLTVIYSGYRLRVRRQEWSLIEEQQTGTFKGVPTDYAYYGEKFRLFPIPNQAATLNLAYHQRVAAPALGTDQTVWMNEAEELIRSAAKRRLFVHVVPDENDAQLMLAAEKEALRTLEKETARRTGTGRVRPTSF